LVANFANDGLYELVLKELEKKTKTLGKNGQSRI